MIDLAPFKIHAVLTDDGAHFTTPGDGCSAAREIRKALQWDGLFRAHAFEPACARAGIDHRRAKPNHPWTTGQMERMKHMIEAATVRRYDDDSHDQLRAHLANFLDACNFGKRLMSLSGLTPFERICKAWTDMPSTFDLNPIHCTPGIELLAPT